MEGGFPKWPGLLTPEEWAQVGFMLISHTVDRTHGLYGISGPKTIIDKITGMTSVLKVVDQAAKEAVLDKTTTDKINAKLSTLSCASIKPDTTAYKAGEDICKAFSGPHCRGKYDGWGLVDPDVKVEEIVAPKEEVVLKSVAKSKKKAITKKPK